MKKFGFLGLPSVSDSKALCFYITLLDRLSYNKLAFPAFFSSLLRP